jgi:NifB/MoaA-like Fe-S oxidoreductase
VSDKRLKDLNIQVLGIDSEFWGKEVTVTGLLTGHDIISALQKKYEEYIIFIPEVCMTRGYFLDELHKKNIKNKFKNIHFIKGDSESLISSLRKELSDKSERFKR